MMTNDLRPCPFCGGEAHASLAAYASGATAHALCDGCGAVVLGYGRGERGLRDAVKRWNRRAERTCRDTDYDTESITCSECGEITRNTLFWVDVDGGHTVKGHRPRFCSNCGAKVVSK